MMKIIIKIALVVLCCGIIKFSNAQNSLTLIKSKELALQNNARVKNGSLEVEASIQTKKSAFTNYFPKLSATGLIIKNNEPLIKYSLPGGNLPVYDGNPANLALANQFAYFPGTSLSLLDEATFGAVTAVQPLYAGRRIGNGNQLAQLGVDVNKSRLILSTNEVLLKTEEQYWLVVSLNEKMKTLKMVENLLDTIYKQANDAYHAGLINRNDVMKVIIKQSEMRVNHIKLENGIRLASMAFCQNIGIPYDSTLMLTDSLNISQTPYEVFINADQALLSREEYKLLNQSIKAEELQTRLKRGEYLPEIAVGAGALYYDFSKEATNTMVFATVKIPISDWWGASHTLKERKLKEQIARNNSKNNSELLILQTQKNWNELNEAYKQIEVAYETIAQAEENLRINSDNYESGIVNISDMLESQAMLRQAKDELTDALSAYKIKLVSYLQATGRYE